MTNNPHTQKGSAHLVIIVVLILVIISAVGFIFWQNFIKKDTTTMPISTRGMSSSKVGSATYKTYTTDVYGISFQYPESWSVGNFVKSDEQDNVSRSLVVTATSGQQISFQIGIRGLGGTCDTPGTFKVIDTSTTTIPGQKPVNFSFTLQPEANGTFEGYFGLTDYYTTIGDVKVCPNTFYYVFSPTNNDIGLIQFDAKRSFVDVDGANKYITSDEYKSIKKMITSLGY